ncbi:MAG: DUF4412 domain-containing protein [Bacteroidota bacterium]
MKKLMMVVLMIAMGTMISQTYAQDLKKLIKKKENTEETTESQEENSGGVLGNVNKGIDKFQEKFLGGKKGETEEQSTETEQPEETEKAEKSDDEDLTKYKTSDEAAEKSMMKMFGITGNVKMKEKYEFDGYMKMVIKTYDKKGKLEESTDYYTYLSKTTPDYAMVFVNPETKDKSTIVFDTENLTMLTLGESDGEKTGFAITITEDQVQALKEKAEEEGETAETEESMPASYTKTGRSKKILGYDCDEYRYEDEEGTAEIWITQDLNGKMSKGYMENSAFGGYFNYAYASNGTVLEYVFVDKQDGEKMTMTVDELDLDKKNNISTSGYNVMSMGGGPAKDKKKE